MSDGQSYFDASAMAKLVLRNEIGAALAAEIWDSDSEAYTSILTYPEACSAIVRAQRDGRLSSEDLDPALSQFERYWQDALVVELTAAIAKQAMEIVRRYSLSGADAVHIASALAAGADVGITFVTWDRRQALAANDMSLRVVPKAI